MTMMMARLERLCVAVVDGTQPTSDEWARWTTLLREAGNPLRVMVETRSGPDAAQRKALATATRGRDVRFAILTDSVVVRGIVTALEWLGVPHRAFAPHEAARAAAFLDLDAVECKLAAQELARLRRQLEAQPPET